MEMKSGSLIQYSLDGKPFHGVVGEVLRGEDGRVSAFVVILRGNSAGEIRLISQDGSESRKTYRLVEVNS